MQLTQNHLHTPTMTLKNLSRQSLIPRDLMSRPDAISGFDPLNEQNR
jgi:hypothetical protein